jgi:flagellar protein FlgJ
MALSLTPAAAAGFDIGARLALDVQSVDNLRLQAKQDPKAAVKLAAQQFEAMFLNILFKSMRAATPQDSPFESEQSRMFQQMSDEQLAQRMATSGHGTGLADVLARQLMRSVAPAETPAAGGDGKGLALHPAGSPIALPRAASHALERKDASASPGMPLQSAPGALPGAAASPLTAASGQGTRKDFVNRLWPHAEEAAHAIGVSPHFLVAQAALESGWGKAEIKGADGAPTHNLFGVKAGAGWSGKVAYAPTTEYVNGKPQSRLEPFRAYGSYAEAFRDYAKLITGNPRYAGAVEDAADPSAFAHALQKAGYATDPHYASKLDRIMASGTFRQALAA